MEAQSAGTSEGENSPQNRAAHLRGPQSSVNRCEATTDSRTRRWVSVRKCTLLVDFFPARESIIWLIWWFYLLAEHYRSVQKKTAMQTKMFRKCYEHFSDEHVWDVSKISIRTFGTSHLFNFAQCDQSLTFFCQKLPGFVSGGQSWNPFSWNSPCVFDFGHFHVFKKLTDMIS